jgi:hypothetical protein
MDGVGVYKGTGGILPCLINVVASTRSQLTQSLHVCRSPLPATPLLPAANFGFPFRVFLAGLKDLLWKLYLWLLFVTLVFFYPSLIWSRTFFSFSFWRTAISGVYYGAMGDDCGECRRFSNLLPLNAPKKIGKREIWRVCWRSCRIDIFFITVYKNKYSIIFLF